MSASTRMFHAFLLASLLYIVNAEASNTNLLISIDDNATQNSNLLPEDYDKKHYPPLHEGLPNLIEFSIKIRDIVDVDEINMDMTLEMYFRVYWPESRVQLPDDLMDNPTQAISIDPQDIASFWVPDVYIDHLKSLYNPKVLTNAASFRVYGSKRIRFSSSLTTKIACTMDFKFYPLDSQVCKLQIESYGLPVSINTYAWIKPYVHVGKGVRLEQFNFRVERAPPFNTTYHTGSYPALAVYIHLQRQLSNHLFQTYVPSALFVVVSWLSLLVPPDIVPGRMVLCITTLLTLTTMFAAIRQNGPQVSYVKALDVWMVTCIIFVFFTLAEYTVLTCVRAQIKKVVGEKKRESDNDMASDELPPMLTAMPMANSISNSASGLLKLKNISKVHPLQNHVEKTKQAEVEPGANSRARTYFAMTSAMFFTRRKAHERVEEADKWSKISDKMEKWTAISLPSLFLIFNIIYWSYYLSSSGALNRIEQLEEDN